jgi:hypothetical protein
VSVGIGTIHSVKGQTHAATLLVECVDRHGNSDAPFMLKALNGSLTRKDAAKTTVQSILQLGFVAITRPRELLCVAAYRPGVQDELAAMSGRGWDVITV